MAILSVLTIPSRPSRFQTFCGVAIVSKTERNFYALNYFTGGNFTIVNQKSSIDFTTFINWSKSTGLVI